MRDESSRLWLGLSFDKFLYYGECFGLGGVKVIVDDDAVELGREGELVLSLVDTLLDDLGCIGAATFESAAQLLHRGGLYEERQGAIAIVLLDVASAYDINVEHDVLPGFELTLYLSL